CGEALGLDLIHHPELLEQPEHATMSAAWYWSSRGLNSLVDKGDFLQITRRINGGTNGLADRQALYDRALKVLA
ncbi:glycoside hydrolase family 19 protein, partial [Pseudomonas syringae group genomosp. 3]